MGQRVANTVIHKDRARPSSFSEAMRASMLPGRELQYPCLCVPSPGAASVSWDDGRRWILRDKKKAPRGALFKVFGQKGQKDRLRVINSFEVTMFRRGKKISPPSLIREFRNGTAYSTTSVLTGAE